MRLKATLITELSWDQVLRQERAGVEKLGWTIRTSLVGAGIPHEEFGFSVLMGKGRLLWFTYQRGDEFFQPFFSFSLYDTDYQALTSLRLQKVWRITTLSGCLLIECSVGHDDRTELYIYPDGSVAIGGRKSWDAHLAIVKAS